MRADFDFELKRLKDRGVGDDRLVEAFTSEHRGTQYIAAQLLSCRSCVDISIPFAERRLLSLASSIPIYRKINNRLNQRILRDHAPGLLRFPIPSTPFLSAQAPLLAQEVCRVLRRVGQRYGARKHYSWSNWEFTKQGKAMETLLDGLKWPFWNKEQFHREVLWFKNSAASSEFVIRRLLKACQMDFMLNP